MGIGMKTGTGMGTGTYSLLIPSSTSRETISQIRKHETKMKCLNCVQILSAQLCDF